MGSSSELAGPEENSQYQELLQPQQHFISGRLISQGLINPISSSNLRNPLGRCLHTQRAPGRRGKVRNILPWRGALGRGLNPQTQLENLGRLEGSAQIQLDNESWEKLYFAFPYLLSKPSFFRFQTEKVSFLNTNVISLDEKFQEEIPVPSQSQGRDQRPAIELVLLAGSA